MAFALAILAWMVPAVGAEAAGKPIVYVVVIDGLDGDSVEAGHAPFISSLLAGSGARATYFPRIERRCCRPRPTPTTRP